MPNAALRALLAIIALIAALLMAGVGAGVAGAEPGGPDPVTTSDEGTPDPLPVSEPQPTTDTLPKVVPSIFDIPNAIVGQLTDLVRRPLSIFGNGRVPGTHTLPDATTPGGATTAPKHDKPVAKPVEPLPPKPKPAKPVDESPAPVKVWKPSSAVDVTLPFSPLISLPFPDVPVPGHETMRWTLNLSDPLKAYSSVAETVVTVNSLLADALAPYNPFQPKPKPQPEPTFRILQEEPVVDAGATGSVTPMSDASPQLPVVQAPLVVPPMRIPSVRPVAGTPTAGSQAVGDGSAGVSAPAVRGSVAQTGSAPVEQLPANASISALPNPGMGGPALREGYPRYLRSARMNQVATVALPGLAGLIAITASGGLIGYRQANSGRYLRSEAARFLQ